MKIVKSLVRRDINVSSFNSKYSTQLTAGNFKNTDKIDADHEVGDCIA